MLEALKKALRPNGAKATLEELKELSRDLRQRRSEAGARIRELEKARSNVLVTGTVEDLRKHDREVEDLEREVEQLDVRIRMLKPQLEKAETEAQIAGMPAEVERLEAAVGRVERARRELESAETDLKLKADGVARAYRTLPRGRLPDVGPELQDRVADATGKRFRLPDRPGKVPDQVRRIQAGAEQGELREDGARVIRPEPSRRH